MGNTSQRCFTLERMVNKMIITIREINGIGNALQQNIENKTLTNIIHKQVLRMVKHKITKVNLKGMQYVIYCIIFTIWLSIKWEILKSMIRKDGKK